MSRRAVICIDDENIVLDSLKEQLMNEFSDDFVIETADSGEEALEIYEELMEDGIEVPVVISDYLMPEITGDRVLEDIYKLDKGVKTVLLTGQASVGGIEYAVNKANLYRFISKPWDKDDLIMTVKEAVVSYDQVKTIEKQHSELVELNQNLEKKVEQRTAELKELNATKDKFFSIIAHDLKNPFNTILGFAELLSDQYDSFDDDKRSEFIGYILKTSKNGYELLANLLEWSRSQTGRIECVPIDVDLNYIIEETLGVVVPQADKKNIKISHTSGLPNVYADSNMIKTVLRNLLSNAIKFTPKGGEIKLEGKDVDDMLQLYIIDNGVGISEDSIAKLFKIDQSHSTEGTEHESGTGLGLILCKDFIEKNNGSIAVESQVGEGSKFIISLPLKEKG
ncbi:hybrid sensor histidine kinase/response regulator [Bacteroidales bacterium]|nr:hybrid sensor histidine kinase/response regulator [Bacteroidales bacterium]